MSSSSVTQPQIADRNKDFYSWAIETAAAIRAGRLNGVDWLAIAEEIEDMGRSERRALASRLEVLYAHLLKWRHQPERRTHSWSGTIKEQRRRAGQLLGDNPGLKSQLAELATQAYPTARALAERDTGLDESVFPPTAPWTVAQALNESFWPSATEGGMERGETQRP